MAIHNDINPAQRVMRNGIPLTPARMPNSTHIGTPNSTHIGTPGGADGKAAITQAGSMASGYGDASFAQALGNAARRNGGLAIKFTKHAEARLLDRNISLSDAQKEKLAAAIDRADNKGVRDALVMIDGFALVANTRTRTVITAISEADLKQNIFTNIDGAVFA